MTYFPKCTNENMTFQFGERVDTFVESITQALNRIKKKQVSQQANPISERPKGTLPSQPLSNPRNFRQVNEAQDLDQCNVIHTLRSGRQDDNQVSRSSNPTQAPTPSSSTPHNFVDKSVE